MTAAFPQTQATLLLLQPMIERLDAAHASAGRQFLAVLQDLARGAEVTSDDPRFEPHLAFMRQAFARQTAWPEGGPFQNWSDLHHHLRFAFVPFGRALLDLHSEAAIAQPAMDALMLAAGLSGMLQHAPAHFRESGRILLPVQWFPAGTDIAAWLTSTRRNPALQTAYGNGLARLDELLLAAERGLAALHNAGLRDGAKASLFLMRRLQKKLAQRTPNVRPVAITLLDRLRLRFASR
jgi:hypothetical protein